MIHVVTDTTSGLPADLARRYDIPVIPQVVIFGDEFYLEGVEMDPATFLGRLRTAKTLPKTAAPPPGLFTDLFRQRVRPGDTVLCIHPSVELSGTVRSALTAAAEFPDLDIRVLDTRTIASPLAALVVLAAQMGRAGGERRRHSGPSAWVDSPLAPLLPGRHAGVPAKRGADRRRGRADRQHVAG
ncbi:MAG: DegV family protein [Anaerolineae bacterium]